MKNAQREFGLETVPQCVLADGPQETDGDGGFEYTVCFGDDEGEPICENGRCMWRLWDFEEVRRFSQQLAKTYGLELLDDTIPA